MFWYWLFLLVRVVWAMVVALLLVALVGAMLAAASAKAGHPVGAQDGFCFAAAELLADGVSLITNH